MFLLYVCVYPHMQLCYFCTNCCLHFIFPPLFRLSEGKLLWTNTTELLQDSWPKLMNCFPERLWQCGLPAAVREPLLTAVAWPWSAQAGPEQPPSFLGGAPSLPNSWVWAQTDLARLGGECWAGVGRETDQVPVLWPKSSEHSSELEGQPENK